MGADGRVDPRGLDRGLYVAELPPVDVVVRTSGEQRVSNFMLWQSAGAKILFSDEPWPTFGATGLDAALALCDE